MVPRTKLARARDKAYLVKGYLPWNFILEEIRLSPRLNFQNKIHDSPLCKRFPARTEDKEKQRREK